MAQHAVSLSALHAGMHLAGFLYPTKLEGTAGLGAPSKVILLGVLSLLRCVIVEAMQPPPPPPPPH
jgi:hypothetical protein